MSVPSLATHFLGLRLLELYTISEGDNEVSTSRIDGATSKGRRHGTAPRTITICNKIVERRHTRRPASEISDEHGGLPAEDQLPRAYDYFSVVAGECIAELRCIDA